MSSEGVPLDADFGGLCHEELVDLATELARAKNEEDDPVRAETISHALDDAMEELKGRARAREPGEPETELPDDWVRWAEEDGVPLNRRV